MEPSRVRHDISAFVAFRRSADTPPDHWGEARYVQYEDGRFVFQMDDPRFEFRGDPSTTTCEFVAGILLALRRSSPL